MNRRKQKITTYFILSALLLIGVVYAILQANLQINGTAKIQANTWDIHFDNIVVNENSVSIGENDSAATIDPENNCKIDFEVTLSLPGDFYEFTVDVVNTGTIDGMIGELNKTLKVNNEDVQETPEYLEYSVSYADGMEILENHKIEAGETEIYKVRLEFKTDIEELPEETTITTSLEPQYLQADSSAVPVRHPVSFSDDDWDTIAMAIRNQNTSVYQIGDTKTIEMEEYGTHTLRLVNKSFTEECENTDFSQTACGFVIEFADIVSLQQMKDSDTNQGGWKDSLIRPYVNTTIYEDLPVDLQNVIIDTYVNSGHGSISSSNYITTDKLYLYSTKEVGFPVQFDSTNLYTRTLDYYSIDSPNRIKEYNNVAQKWWYRVPDLNHSVYFRHATADNKEYYSNPTTSLGVSPAFRID